MRHQQHSMIATQALRRIDEVLAGTDCPWPAMAPELQLLVVLKSHVGRQDIIQLAQLVELLSVSERAVKAMVSNLRLNFRVQIGSSRDSEAGGYYVIATAEEARDTVRPLISQALAMLKVARIMLGRHAMNEIFGQLRLKLGLDQEGEN